MVENASNFEPIIDSCDSYLGCDQQTHLGHQLRVALLARGRHARKQAVQQCDGEKERVVREAEFERDFDEPIDHDAAHAVALGCRDRSRR